MKRCWILKQIIYLALFLPLFSRDGFALTTSSLFIDLARVMSGQKGWQEAWAAGFGVSFPITSNSAFFLNFNRWRFEISGRDNRLLGGRLTLSPLSAGFYFLILPRKVISPLSSLGTGYFFSQYHFDQKDIVTIPEIIKITKKINGHFSWQTGAGLRLQLIKRAYFWFLIERYQTSLSIETTIVDLNLGTKKYIENFKFTPFLYRVGLQLNI